LANFGKVKERRFRVQYAADSWEAFQGALEPSANWPKHGTALQGDL
jgi:hypothetical protein